MTNKQLIENILKYKPDIYDFPPVYELRLNIDTNYCKCFISATYDFNDDESFLNHSDECLTEDQQDYIFNFMKHQFLENCNNEYRRDAYNHYIKEVINLEEEMTKFEDLNK